MSSENRVGNTGDLVASYCSLSGLSIHELAEETGLIERLLEKLVSGKMEFSRDGIVAIIEVLDQKMKETGQKDKFTFDDKKKLLESAGYGLVAGYINTEDIPPGCLSGMSPNPNRDI